MKANQKPKLAEDKEANVEMITMGIVAAVMFAIAVPIIFNVMGSLNTATIDTNIKTNVWGMSASNDNDDANASWNATIPAGNATNSILTQVNSFFSIGPIYLVVVVAVGIIAAILVLRRFGGY